MVGAVLALILTGAAAVAASPVELLLKDRNIRMGDVAALTGLTLAGHKRFASRVIATLPRGRASISVTRDDAIRLVRRNVPGLGGRAEGGNQSVSFRLSPPLSDIHASPEGCARTSQPIAAGAALKPADVVMVACSGERMKSALTFDRRSSAVRAATSLAAGVDLGRLVLSIAPDVDKGDKLMLVSSVGPVRVERSVVALQAGRSGGRVFVLDAEGQVVAAPLAVANAQGGHQ